MNKNLIINVISLNLILSIGGIYYILFFLDIFDYSDNIKYIIFLWIFLLEFFAFLWVKNIIKKQKKR